MKNIKPINAPFRWAGSKAKITTTLFDHFLENDIYVEPFLGSGVVLFRLLQIKKYKRYIVNDINVSIITLYMSLQRDCVGTVNTLLNMESIYNNHPDKEKFYYQCRDEFNKDKSNFPLFWLLMKAGFNGLYRENKKGLYNVPFGKKSKILLNVDDMISISDLIQDVEFYCMDYQDFYNMLNLNSAFAYNDPPYCQSQQYTKDKFDNKELAKFLKKSGIDIAISDVDSIESNEIYKGFKKINVQSVDRVFSTKNIHKVNEVLYVNYNEEGRHRKD